MNTGWWAPQCMRRKIWGVLVAEWVNRCSKAGKRMRLYFLLYKEMLCVSVLPACAYVCLCLHLAAQGKAMYTLLRVKCPGDIGENRAVGSIWRNNLDGCRGGIFFWLNFYSAHFHIYFSKPLCSISDFGELGCRWIDEQAEAKAI